MPLTSERFGTLYGIGTGPGDPELITVKAAAVLGRCRHVFAPRTGPRSQSVALEIARTYFGENTSVQQIEFPMITDRDELEHRWQIAAEQVLQVLQRGDDACFVTLGDPLLYSTYIYLLRALKRRAPNVRSVTVPGIMALNAVSALTEFPVGEGKRPVHIIPTADDLAAVDNALDSGGTVVLMKLGKRLSAILEILKRKGLLEQAVFVSRAGMSDQRIETDLRQLEGLQERTGYLSIILVNADRKLANHEEGA